MEMDCNYTRFLYTGRTSWRTIIDNNKRFDKKQGVARARQQALCMETYVSLLFAYIIALTRPVLAPVVSSQYNLVLLKLYKIKVQFLDYLD